MDRFHIVSPETLMRMIGAPNAPTLIDVSVDEDVAADPYVLPTAVRWPHAEVAALVPRLAGRAVVTICQKGRKLSQGAAAMLRSHGVAAQALEGGNLGWRAADLPRLRLDRAPVGASGSLWVTSPRVEVDRIAALWLIRRFVDPEARILCVAREEASDVAGRFGAIQLDDATGMFGSTHLSGAFEAMLAAFDLDFAPLVTMAEVVGAATNGRFGDAPQACGLAALVEGRSRIDGTADISTGAFDPIIDALYHWAREAARADRPAARVTT